MNKSYYYFTKVRTSRPMTFIKNIHQGLLVAAISIVLIVMIITVVLRYIFKTDLYGAEEILLIAALWLYFMGGISGSMENSQIKADVFVFLVKNLLVKGIVNIITTLIEFVVLVFLCVMTLKLLSINFDLMPTTSALKIPLVVSQLSIIVGFLFMALYTLGHLFEAVFNVIDVLKKKEI